MELKTRLDIGHKLDRVTWRKSVAEQCFDYFKRFPENEAWFIKELDELYHRNKYYGQYRNHISLTAVPLANKIYEQLDTITFPFLLRVACRGWDTSGGTWAWSMKTVHKGQHIEDIGSADPPKYLLLKKINLFILNSGEIVGQPSPLIKRSE